MDQIFNYVTCIAAVGLFIATCALVWVTIHHAHSAEKMVAAADRLGEILDGQAKALAEVANQAKALADVAGLNALVTAAAAGPSLSTGRHNTELQRIVTEWRERREVGEKMRPS